MSLHKGDRREARESNTPFELFTPWCNCDAFRPADSRAAATRVLMGDGGGFHASERRFVRDRECAAAPK